MDMVGEILGLDFDSQPIDLVVLGVLVPLDCIAQGMLVLEGGIARTILAPDPVGNPWGLDSFVDLGVDIQAVVVGRLSVDKSKKSLALVELDSIFGMANCPDTGRESHSAANNLSPLSYRSNQLADSQRPSSEILVQKLKIRK